MHIGNNVTLKIINRQIESKSKRLFCPCDIIKFNNIQTEHFDKQLCCYQKQKWISVKHGRYIFKMKKYVN